MQNRPEVLVNIARYTARLRIRTARGNGREIETERYNAIARDSAKYRYGRAHLARTSTRDVFIVVLQELDVHCLLQCLP